MSQHCDKGRYTLKSSLSRKIFEKLALFYMCLENCVGATIFCGNIPKSFDYMPKMPNKIVSVDPEGCMVGLSGPPPMSLFCRIEKFKMAAICTSYYAKNHISSPITMPIVNVIYGFVCLVRNLNSKKRKHLKRFFQL